jgi:hypothetical protein
MLAFHTASGEETLREMFDVTMAPVACATPIRSKLVVTTNKMKSMPFWDPYP